MEGFAASLLNSARTVALKGHRYSKRRSVRVGAPARETKMTKQTTDVIQGTLDMLILKTLSVAPMHGYGIARRIEQVSRGVFKVNPGSVLTSLHRLGRAGWLDDEWRRTGAATAFAVLPRPLRHSAFTACSPTRWHSARARSRCASRSVRRPRGSASWCYGRSERR